MEANTQEKPRLTYAQFIASQPAPQPDSPLLVRSIIARFIAEMNWTPEAPGVKPLEPRILPYISASCSARYTRLSSRRARRSLV